MTQSETSPEPVLRLVRERKIYELIGGKARDRLEASGVCCHDGRFYVIFDNSPHIGRLDYSLDPKHPENRLLRQRGESAGFEDVTFHEKKRRFLIIIEAVPFDSACYKPVIEEYDDEFRYLESNWADFPLEGENKGIEGLTYLRRNDRDYVLGLCEGNDCKSGAAGRKPGAGRIQVFLKGNGQWDHIGTVELPPSVQFVDYASLRVDGQRIAVVSQVSSKLWIGKLHQRDFRFVDDGQIYRFPRSPKGKILYCNIEGVDWMSANRIVVVSDKTKPGSQRKKCFERDQSIHIFDIPKVEAED